MSMSEKLIRYSALQNAEKIGKIKKVIEDNALSLLVVLKNCNIYYSTNEEVLQLEFSIFVYKHK